MTPIEPHNTLRMPLRAACAVALFLAALLQAFSSTADAMAPLDPASSTPSPMPSTAPSLQSALVEVSLTSGLTKVGEPVAIRITVTQGGGGKSAKVSLGSLPVVDGITFGQAQGAGTRSERSVDSRGRRVTRTSSSYLVPIQPAGAGEYSIPPISVTVGGEIFVRPVQSMELRVVEDLTASDLLFLERADVPKRVFEGEPYTIELDWGWDDALEPQSLSLRVPWYGQQDGVVELERPRTGNEFEFPASGNQRITVVGLPNVTRDGQEFRTFRLRRRYVATRAGKVEFSRSIFEFTPKPERGSRFIRGRGRSYYRPLDPFSIEVLPIPENGRPIEWTGAVGTLTASREALRRDVDAGEPIDFEITYGGEGNLEFFPAPDLSRMPAFDGFRVLGVDDEKGPYERIIKYDLVPLDASAVEIPSVPLTVFDTKLEKFVTLSTEPLEIRVRKAAGAGGADPFGEKVEEEAPPAIILRDIEARPVGAPGGASKGGFFQRGPGAGSAFLGLILSLVGWRILRRVARAKGDPAGLEARRRRGALRSLERGLKSSDAKELSAALETFLAARTGTEPAEWIGQAALPEDSTKLSAQLKEDYAQLRHDLDAAIFGGQAAQAPDPNRIRSFARAATQGGL